MSPAPTSCYENHSAPPPNSLENKSNNIKIASADKYEDVNELLAITDILVTDYSSIYKDFMLVDRPMIFIPYDYDEYKTEKGLLYDYFDTIPGPAVDSQKDFLNEVESAIKNDPYEDKRQERCEVIHKHRDNQSSDRVAELIESMVR
ncbi:CDP-glycerol glycerophosphotransferase family protein [Salinarchaeum sp. IM2453]|uniref:CDP-glycerol glycerophosphotransferase family protein n=1 Tax=Salinarchaeum sp. IM2453 TaxID=2862870 RepID=UPI001C831DD6|nr:CDP-glycerol glycerophosphotransferase family protein [Salinarchaeum sp. IM2453]QZA89095.1 CDP-glycerol glycerophosphotransferase family protein [Salinarchaeum sp. IM2453]